MSSTALLKTEINIYLSLPQFTQFPRHVFISGCHIAAGCRPFRNMVAYNSKLNMKAQWLLNGLAYHEDCKKAQVYPETMRSMYAKSKAS